MRPRTQVIADEIVEVRLQRREHGMRDKVIDDGCKDRVQVSVAEVAGNFGGGHVPVWKLTWVRPDCAKETWKCDIS